MLPAITLRNLPLKLNLFVLETIFSANRIQWKDAVICPDSDDSLIAYVLLKGAKSVKYAMRKMNECEISDQIIEILPSTEEEIARFEEELEKTRQKEKELAQDNNNNISSSEHIKSPNGNKEKKDNGNDDKEEVDDIECLPFSAMGLSDGVMKNLERLKFETATPIQTLAIPPAMEGCDIIGRAQTGTGKTLAFGIPIVEALIKHPGKGLRALVIAPTRELAVQIKDVIAELILDTGLKTLVVFGGDDILDQMLTLRDGMDILIATPGRLLDIQGRGRLRVDAAEILVLDEADRMLDMGFLPQMTKIFQCFYEHPQTMLFSATIPTELGKLTGINLKNPVLVDVGQTDLTPLDSVSQKVLFVSPEEKENCLYNLLDHESGPVLVFAKTKRSTERLAQRLKSRGYSATRIHGDIDQSIRTRAVEAFRNGEFKILVATDVASRGLDIDGISHVVNFDLPMAPEDHLHRIGRTARAGATGKATTFITHKERRTIKPFNVVLGQG